MLPGRDKNVMSEALPNSGELEEIPILITLYLVFSYTTSSGIITIPFNSLSLVSAVAATQPLILT